MKLLSTIGEKFRERIIECLLSTLLLALGSLVYVNRSLVWWVDENKNLVILVMLAISLLLFPWWWKLDQRRNRGRNSGKIFYGLLFYASFMVLFLVVIQAIIVRVEVVVRFPKESAREESRSALFILEKILNEKFRDDLVEVNLSQYSPVSYDTVIIDARIDRKESRVLIDLSKELDALKFFSNVSSIDAAVVSPHSEFDIDQYRSSANTERIWSIAAPVNIAASLLSDFLEQDQGKSVYFALYDVENHYTQRFIAALNSIPDPQLRFEELPKFGGFDDSGKTIYFAKSSEGLENIAHLVPQNSEICIFAPLAIHDYGPIKFKILDREVRNFTFAPSEYLQELNGFRGPHGVISLRESPIYVVSSVIESFLEERLPYSRRFWGQGVFAKTKQLSVDPLRRSLRYNNLVLVRMF